MLWNACLLSLICASQRLYHIPKARKLGAIWMWDVVEHRKAMLCMNCCFKDKKGKLFCIEFLRKMNYGFVCGNPKRLKVWGHHYRNRTFMATSLRCVSGVTKWPQSIYNINSLITSDNQWWMLQATSDSFNQ